MAGVLVPRDDKIFKLKLRLRLGVAKHSRIVRSRPTESSEAPFAGFGFRKVKMRLLQGNRVGCCRQRDSNVQVPAQDGESTSICISQPGNRPYFRLPAATAASAWQPIL